MATEVNGAYPPRDELPIPHHPELEDDTMIRRILERPLESSSKARFNVLDVRKEVVGTITLFLSAKCCLYIS